jgi:hypothetical protein
MTISLQYAVNPASGGWIPIEAAADPSAITIAQTVFALTYGDTTPFVDITSRTRASAGFVSSTLTLDADPEVLDPRGLVTIACSYALNAALTALVPGRMIDETAATLAPVANGSYRNGSLNYAYDGAAFVRVLTGAAANLATNNPAGAQLVQQSGEWAINHTPAANTVATISKAAVASQRHVCKSITVTLVGLAAAAEATVLVNLRDGATGAGTILWSTRLLVTGTTGSQTGVALAGLNIVGSVNTAMTLEFAAAGGANTFEAVAISGLTAA